MKFQSTHPRGVRRDNKEQCKEHKSFNPRTHEGCDAEVNSVPPIGRVSIHAPTRGATRWWLPPSSLPRVSIHAPTRGATNLSYTAPGYDFVSIHAPTRGATNYAFRNFHIPTVSIHAPTRGATLCAGK